VAAKLGLRPAPLSSTAEEVFVHLYMMRPAANHFASPEMRRFETVRRARSALRRVAAALVAAGVGWGAWNMSRAFETTEQDQRVAQQISSANLEYDQITRALPSFGVGGSTMRDSVAFYNAEIRGFPRVTDFALALSQVLQHHPEVRLDQIAWLATDDAKASPPLVHSGAVSSGAPVKALAAAPEASARVPDTSLAPFSTGRYEVALVEATVREPTNDFRDALDTVTRLASEIDTLPGTTADVVDSPLDVRSSVQILGRHDDKEPATMELRFVLRIVRDHGRGA